MADMKEAESEHVVKGLVIEHKYSFISEAAVCSGVGVAANFTLLK